MLINKTKLQVSNIIYNDYYLKVKKSKLTGGKGIKKLLENINLKKRWEKTNQKENNHINSKKSLKE